MQRRAGIYCRISDDREGRELGVGRQRDDCTGLAGRLGSQVVDVYVDNDISASTRTRRMRPEYRRLLADARSGRIDQVIAYTSNRLTRKPRESEDLIELAEGHGVQLAYVASPSFDLNTAAGRRVARILAATDAGEAEDIAERIARQKLEAAVAGRWRGGPRPFGYAADGVSVVPVEAAEVRRAAEALLAGASLRTIAADMNARGVLTSTGGRWSGTELRRVVSRPRNAGLINRGEEIVGPANWPAILDEGTWLGVRAVLADPARKTTTGGQRRWLLSGIAVCGIDGCTGRVMVTQVGSGRAGTKPSYTCTARKHLTRDVAAVDEYVRNIVVGWLSRPDAIDLLRVDAPVDTAALSVQSVALRQRLDELGVMFARGVLDARQVEAASRELHGELADVERRIGEAYQRSVFAGLVGAADVGAVWDGLVLERRRAVVRALMTVTLLRSRKGRRPGWRPGQTYLDRASVRITRRGRDGS